MIADITMRVVYNRASKIGQRIHRMLETKTIENLAQMARAKAEELAAKDTTAMSLSVYVNGPNSSDYAEHRDQAISARPELHPDKEGPEVLVEVERPKAMERNVAVGASYGIYQEMGTVKMAAHPFLGPAFEYIRDKIPSKVAADINAELRRFRA